MTQLTKQDFYFDLPKELIAQTPIEDRSGSRLLVLDKKTGALEHKVFTDIINYLHKGDCLVLNDTKVMAARLFGTKAGTGAKVELLLLKKLDGGRFEVMAKPGKKVRPGDLIEFGGGILKAHVEMVTDGGNRIVSMVHDGIFEEILDELGEMPLPPYIKEKLADKSRYQTVYAAKQGSAAAPTAGLHFTDGLLDVIAAKGVSIARITLHVGLGTFRPVKVDNILEHKMHSEYYDVSESQADIINHAKKSGGKIIAVGTTSCRTLESVADNDGLIKPGFGDTNIFIYPGYKFKTVDKLITNFHLPESTLIMLVSALCGRENILKAYEEAIRNKYRFFSFGDCCFIM